MSKWHRMGGFKTSSWKTRAKARAVQKKMKAQGYSYAHINKLAAGYYVVIVKVR